MRFIINGGAGGAVPIGAIGTARDTPVEALAVAEDYARQFRHVTVSDNGRQITIEQLRKLAGK